MLGFSWGAFCVYVVALSIVVGGSFIGLLQFGHPAFLAPLLLGLFYFYLCWECCVEDWNQSPPRGKKQGM